MGGVGAEGFARTAGIRKIARTTRTAGSVAAAGSVRTVWETWFGDTTVGTKVRTGSGAARGAPKTSHVAERVR